MEAFEGRDESARCLGDTASLCLSEDLLQAWNRWGKGVHYADALKRKSVFYTLNLIIRLLDKVPVSPRFPCLKLAVARLQVCRAVKTALESDFSSWSNVDLSSGCRGEGSVPGQLHSKGYLTMREAAVSTLTLIGFYSSLPSSNRDSLPRGVSDWSHAAAPTLFPLCSGLIFSPTGPAPSWNTLGRAIFSWFLRFCLHNKR